jgi:serine protease Do
MTLGYPLGQQGLKSTVGVISGRESLEYRQFIQIDAPINPGNSGGPSLNFDGQVIGINTAGIPGAQNVGYIIPINEIKTILADLYKREAESDKMLRKPFLGIGYGAGSLALNALLGNPPGGVYITEVFKGSLLYNAGVKKGDILYEINGYRIDSYGQINVAWCEDKISIDNYSFYLRLGEPVKLVVYRKSERKELTVMFENVMPPAIRIMHPDFETIDYEVIGGMVIMQLARNHLPLLLNYSPMLIRYNEPKFQLKPALVITHVIPDSVAQRSRVIMPASLLKQVNGVKVHTLEELRNALLKSAQTNYVTVRVSEGFFAVFPVQQILNDEARLSFIYKYPISVAVKTLAELVETHEQQKTS